MRNTEYKALEPFIQKYAELSDAAEEVVLRRIEALCRRYNWRFSSVGFGYNVERRDGSEVYSKEVDKMLSLYGEYFHSIGFYVCEYGEWIGGQTPLIQFGKPTYAQGKPDKA